MQGNRKYCLWLLLAVSCCYYGHAQMPASGDTTARNAVTDTIPASPAPATVQFSVRDILIEGNRKTRPEIILREIPFKPGEMYILQELVKKNVVASSEARNKAANKDNFAG